MKRNEQRFITKDEMLRIINECHLMVTAIDGTELVVGDDEEPSEIELLEANGDGVIAVPIPPEGIQLLGNCFLVGNYRLEVFQLREFNIARALDKLTPPPEAQRL